MLNYNELYTIQQILDEYELPVCIKKQGWTEDFYFRIEHIENSMAKGTAFKNGKIHRRLFGEYKYTLSETAMLYGDNMSRYDSSGFDKYGFDRSGFDREGFGHDGYSRYGYDREGYNKDGYNILGYDRAGYNEAGYDRYGFDRNGLDRDGYNRTGYAKNGFDRDGYNKYGYDNRGFDRQGYDKTGYDRSGFNRDGFDRFGYDRNGFDKSGYDKAGYDDHGYNKSGYNRSGYNREGYDKEGYDREGYNKIGFNKSGFNRQGFNSKGYNKSGYDINGFDRDGYNHRGYNKDGYDRKGYDRNGYDRRGFNKFGIDSAGNFAPELNSQYHSGKTLLYHDTYGKGVFTRFTSSSSGLYIHVDFKDKKDVQFSFPDSLGKFIFIDKTEKEKKKEALLSTDYGKEENKKEREFFNRINAEISEGYNKCIHKYENELNDSNVPVEENGFFHYAPATADHETTQEKNLMTALYRQPYFAKVDYSKNHDFYIGKQSYRDIITDWADPEASVYYDYKMYIGNNEYNLSVIRNFDIYLGQFYGFIDAYNRLSDITVNETSSSAKLNSSVIDDDRLLMIISAQRKDKNVHDIIASIQSNQYKIITSDMNTDVIVEGCAGSGKTMILLHRLRYLLRNNKELKADSICALSPTDILNIENCELSASLQLNEVNRFSNISLYCFICSQIAKAKSLYWPVTKESYLPNSLLPDYIIEKVYSYLDLNSAVDFVKNVINYRYRRGEFINHERVYIQEIKNALSTYGIITSTQDNALQNLVQKYKKAFVSFRECSTENVEAAIKRLEGGYTTVGDSRKKGVTDNDKRESNILKELLNHSELLSVTINTKIKKVDSPDPYKDLFAIYKDDFPHLKKHGIEIGNDGLSFLARVELLYDKENRLNSFASGKNGTYFYDIIEACIRDAKSAYAINTSIHYEWEMYWKAFLLSSVFKSTNNTKMVFIDEFQDYSEAEFHLLKEYFPNAKFNLFGDFKQSISAKGINPEQFLSLFCDKKFRRFKINENYRNAKEITEFVNKEFGMSMLPVGINGNVQAGTVNAFSYLPFDEEDRVAIIVKSLYEFKKYNFEFKANIINTANDELKRGIINIIPVSLVKGLEFEYVAVLTNNMTENEKYVAMTRALDEVYICEQ